MRTLNLGILAHVDAGKTSLTERLLHTAGVIGALGSVDAGTSQTDSLALERQRGITIKSAVVSFALGDLVVNLIDTPGHPDFIAEVERALGVLHGAILVVSAVEGVQAQTRILMRTLKRLRIPTLIFVNKIDRRGARFQRLVRDIAEKLTPGVIALGTVRDAGEREAMFVPCDADEPGYLNRLIDLVSTNDDALLDALVQDAAVVPYARIRQALAAQTARVLTHPVLFGSAMTGAGVEPLIAAIKEFLPAVEADGTGPVSGTVFKVERDAAGAKVACVYLASGTVRLRERVQLGAQNTSKVTAISVFDNGRVVPQSAVTAGRIGKLSGLGGIRIGDSLGISQGRSDDHFFAAPTLETAVSPRDPADASTLHTALNQLAEQDPLINLRHGDSDQALFLSLYGEVQKEVIAATLADDFGIEAEFHPSTTICVERPIGIGAAVEEIRTGGNPFLATVGLRIEPAPIDSGVHFRLASDVLGTMPLAFFKAVEDAVTATLRQGLHGWQVTDCTVTMTHTSYFPRQSHAHQRFSKSMSSTGEDFRKLTPLVLMGALRQAATVVCEPIHQFRLEAPAGTLGIILAALTRVLAVPHGTVVRGSLCILEGNVPANQVRALQQQIPALTHGEGLLVCTFDHYRPVHDAAPSRPLPNHHPLFRREYLLHLTRPM